MKTALYVATVSRTYRKAIDDYLESESKYRANMDWYREQIAQCTYRQFTTGFYFGKPDENTQIYDNSTYVRDAVYLGMVEEAADDGTVHIEQKNKFCVGDEIEVMKPDGRNIPVKVVSIRDEEGNEQTSAPHARQKLCVTLDPAVCEKYDILRVENK